MAAAKSFPGLILVGVIIACVLAPPLPAGAEELHYKFYTWPVKGEREPVGDVAGHEVGFVLREAILVFEDGQIASSKSVAYQDLVNNAGPFTQYMTITFPADRSTIVLKSQGRSIPSPMSASLSTGEILTGTGRFAGISGTHSAKAFYLPRDPGEIWHKGNGEGTLTYTLPSK